MRDETLFALAGVDTNHWYYRARADSIRATLEPLRPTDGSTTSILDVGCGPGGSTQQLASFGEVVAVDPSDASAELIPSRVPSARFLQGRVGDLDAMLGESTFDVVTCFGVLNHRSIEDPSAAIADLVRRVEPGGLLLLEEPADERLWRQVDRLGESARRFRLEELTAGVERAGMRVVEARYINWWAWPVARLLSAVERVRPPSAEAPPRDFLAGPLDKLGYRLTRIERSVAGRGIRVRLGTGCWIVAQRPTRPAERSPTSPLLRSDRGRRGHRGTGQGVLRAVIDDGVRSVRTRARVLRQRAVPPRTRR